MSNLTRQYRYGTSFDVLYPDFPSFNKQPLWFELTQEQGKQDVLKLAYTSYDKFYQTALKTGALIKLTWKNQNSQGTFHGHFYDSTHTSQATVERNIMVTAVGASFALKEGGSKMWKNKTASEIAIDIAKKNKLKPIVTSSPIRFGQQSLNGHTYWEKLQELAARIGYVCQVIGVELHFHPIDKMIDHFSTVIPALSFQDAMFNSGHTVDGHTLDKFKSKVGSLSELGAHTKKTKNVSGIDSITGKVFNNTSAPSKVGKNVRKTNAAELFKENIPTRVAESPAVAKAMAEGFAQLARFSLHAEGSAQGNANIAPYKTIEINGTGEVTDGFWVVKKATHFCHVDGRYNVEFTCMTDGTGANKATQFRPSSASVVPTRNLVSEMATGMKTKTTQPKISKKVPLVNQSNAGVKLSSNRWVGV